jgi:hypothetical protein
MDKEKIFLDNAIRKVETQIKAIISLKTRGGVLLASTIAMLGFVLSNEVILQRLSEGGFLSLLALVLFFISLAIFLATLFTSQYYYLPMPPSFYENNKSKNDKDIYEILIKELNDSYDKNNIANNTLKFLINSGVSLEFFSLILLFIIVF